MKMYAHPLFQHLILQISSVFDLVWCLYTNIKIIFVLNKKFIWLIVTYVKVAHIFYLKIDIKKSSPGAAGKIIWILRHYLAENAISDMKISKKVAFYHDTKKILKRVCVPPRTKLGIGSWF